MQWIRWCEELIQFQNFIIEYGSLRVEPIRMNKNSYSLSYTYDTVVENPFKKILILLRERKKKFAKFWKALMYVAF